MDDNAMFVCFVYLRQSLVIPRVPFHWLWRSSALESGDTTHSTQNKSSSSSSWRQRLVVIVVFVVFLEVVVMVGGIDGMVFWRSVCRYSTYGRLSARIFIAGILLGAKSNHKCLVALSAVGWRLFGLVTWSERRRTNTTIIIICILFIATRFECMHCVHAFDGDYWGCLVLDGRLFRCRIVVGACRWWFFHRLLLFLEFVSRVGVSPRLAMARSRAFSIQCHDDWCMADIHGLLITGESSFSSSSALCVISISSISIRNSRSAIPPRSCGKLCILTDLETHLHDHCSLVFLLFVAKILFCGWYNNNITTKPLFRLCLASIGALGCRDGHDTVLTISTVCVLHIVLSSSFSGRALVSSDTRLVGTIVSSTLSLWTRVGAYVLGQKCMGLLHDGRQNHPGTITTDSTHNCPAGMPVGRLPRPDRRGYCSCRWRIRPLRRFGLRGMCTKRPFWMCWFHSLFWRFIRVVVVVVVHFDQCCWTTTKKK